MSQCDPASLGLSSIGRKDQLNAFVQLNAALCSDNARARSWATNLLQLHMRHADHHVGVNDRGREQTKVLRVASRPPLARASAAFG